MKFRISIILLTAFFLLISGCSVNDENIPEPAQTATPRPSPSPEPEPEPKPECDHFWKPPDCHNPYICFDCGETKGFPTEHVRIDANFQEASFCLLCGDINGEPLEPGFISSGYTINATAGRPYEYTTITERDREATTVGAATLLYIDFFESDIDYPQRAGYEYISTRLMITFDDENAAQNGFRYLTGQLDFFGFDSGEAAVIYDTFEDSEIPGFKIVNRKLNFFGEDYDYYMKHTQIQNEWIGNISYVVLEYIFLVPAGYDGIVIYLSNAANWTETGSRVISDNFDDETLFFRLRAQTG